MVSASRILAAAAVASSVALGFEYRGTYYADPYSQSGGGSQNKNRDYDMSSIFFWTARVFGRVPQDHWPDQPAAQPPGPGPTTTGTTTEPTVKSTTSDTSSSLGTFIVGPDGTASKLGAVSTAPSQTHADTGTEATPTALSSAQGNSGLTAARLGGAVAAVCGVINV
ncbi:uncharacterized protein DNG_02212 [Cephalotrichum gorgonifer]|uniref:Uncharacterized protein n=1 Tax=Cephalotrichum gorgonifer TaxID=2041049 RepID=A0AAE8MS04_9PEZI|nr:uncharacterized protein DNG_02212 [Cephalotrichum gorgonifer]